MPVCLESLRDAQMQTPLIYAVKAKRRDLVKFMVEEMGCHEGICLREPVYRGEKDGVVQEEEIREWNSSLLLDIAVSNFDIELLDYLLNSLYYLWTLSDLDLLLDSLYTHDFLDALPTVINGKGFRSIVLALTFEEQVVALEKTLMDKFDKDTLESISGFIDDALSQGLFAS